MISVLRVAAVVFLGLAVLLVGCTALMGLATTTDSQDASQSVAGTSVAGKQQTPGTFAADDSQGDMPVAEATGDIDDPETIRLEVGATPPQKSFVTWDMTCTKAKDTSSNRGVFEATTPVDRVLVRPTGKPENCVVSATVQLETSGTVEIALVGSPSPQKRR